jgi:spermidine/putrescine transport system substrate-binding protein
MKNILFALSVLLLAALLAACGEGKKELYIYNWTEYMPDAVIKSFEKETGITVHYSTYDSNEAMYAKLKSVGGKGYDLIIPSTYYVQRMRTEGMLLKLDKSRIANLKNLDPAVLNKPYDPNNDYSIPYLWGTTGIGVNVSEIDPAAITSWRDLWKPEFKDKVLLTDDIREVFGLAFKVLGYSINDTEPKHIEEAYELLKGILPNVRVFTAESPSSVLLNHEATIGMIWNGELFLANNEGDTPGFAYIYPKEGVNVWMDNMAIPSGAANVASAHAFIDYVLKPEVAKAICEEYGYTSPNLEAVKLLPPEIRDNRILYPTAEDMRNSEFMEYIGEAIVEYEKYWERLKTGK